MPKALAIEINPINNVPSLRFVYGRLGDLQIQRVLKGFTSVVAQRVFTSMMQIMQPANRGLACRIPCCGRTADYFRLRL